MPRVSFRAAFDPLVWLRLQMDESVGFAARVGPLVESARQARYQRILESIEPPDEDVALALYEAESGSEEGEGHADFDRTANAAAITLLYELFRDFLVQELLAWSNRQVPPRHKSGDIRTIEGLGLPKLRSKYRDWTGISLNQAIPHWNAVEEIRLCRNAVVHNRGHYTWDYLLHAQPPRFSRNIREVLPSWPKDRMRSFEYLVHLVPVPLDVPYLRRSEETLLDVAKQVRRRLGSASRKRTFPEPPQERSLTRAAGHLDGLVVQAPEAR